jgi:hypothetical protein
MPRTNGAGVLAAAPKAGGDGPDRSVGRCEAKDASAITRLVGSNRLPIRPAKSADSER